MSRRGDEPPQSRFRIGDREVGAGAPCFLIAEVGLGHDGSLGTAHAFIEAVADAGADAVKFQTHIAAEEGTREESFRVNVFPQDRTRREYWERTGFTEDQWRGLKEHCDARGIEFLSSPFSVAAVRMLRRLGVRAWKIGSGETNNVPLLEEIAEGGEPVLLSTGMSYWAEIEAVVEHVTEKGAPLVVMQCTTRYPCPPEEIGLNLIGEFSRRYGLPVGLSDHSGEVAPGLGAVALGAKTIEVHVTWHKKSFGPDVGASLTIEQLAELCRGVRLLEAAMETPVNKDEMADDLVDMRRLFTKGVVAKERLSAGTTLESRHLDAKKPCTGIPARDYRAVLGRVTKREIEKDAAIGWDDLD